MLRSASASATSRNATSMARSYEARRQIAIDFRHPHGRAVPAGVEDRQRDLRDKTPRARTGREQRGERATRRTGGRGEPNRREQPGPASAYTSRRVRLFVTSSHGPSRARKRYGDASARSLADLPETDWLRRSASAPSRPPRRAASSAVPSMPTAADCHRTARLARRRHPSRRSPAPGLLVGRHP
jgi:hypothetical protein